MRPKKLTFLPCLYCFCHAHLSNSYVILSTTWLSRQTDDRRDQCIIAQEQLHPVCAQRGDLGYNPPSCRSLAEDCRAQPDCR